MQGFDDNLFAKKFRDYSLKLHAKRLQEIKTRETPGIDNSLPKTKDFIKPCKKCKEFLTQEKNKSITKQNQQFSRILEEISAGKRETATQKILNSAKDDAQKKRSLNSNKRKKEAIKITEANEFIAKRMQDVQAQLSFQKFQKEWAIVSKYKDSLIRKTPRYSSSDFVQASYLPQIHDRNNETRKLDTSQLAKRNKSKKKDMNQTQRIFIADSEEIDKRWKQELKEEKHEETAKSVEVCQNVENNLSDVEDNSGKKMEN